MSIWLIVLILLGVFLIKVVEGCEILGWLYILLGIIGLIFNS